MCGIIGIFDSDNASLLVKRGLEIMNYRGMDDSGIVNIGNYTIGHCLHSVVNKIKQPIGKNNYITANCEIYNWHELEERFSFGSKNDAELLYFLIEKFGVEKTLHYLDGDYACAYCTD